MLRLLKTKESILIACGLVLLGLGWVVVNATPVVTGQVDWSLAIYATQTEGNELVTSVPMREGTREIYEVSGPLGITTIEVEGTGAHVISSPCPDQLCIKFGWLHEAPDFSACLPNEVLVVVQRPAEVSEGPFGSWDN